MLLQINKIDMSTPLHLAETDARTLQELDTLGYFKWTVLSLLEFQVLFFLIYFDELF